MMEQEQILELIKEAQRAREFSYSPYSNYMVGAAVMTEAGDIYSGCNIENAAYGPTNCGERTAIFKAVSEGKRKFKAIAIVGGKRGGEGDFATPCGVCRQVMMEFCDPETFKIVLAVDEINYTEYTLKELMPLGFGSGNLG